MKELFSKENNGITLVALVITIIMLLILAGITITQLNKNGILSKAKLASEETKKSQVQETIQLAVNDIMTEYISKGKDLTKIKLKEELQKYKTIEGITISDDLIGEYKGYKYYIDENYNVHIGEISNKPIIAKIEVKEEKRIINATITEVNEGIDKIEVINPEGNVIATEESDGATTGKIENCIANQSGDYKIKVTSNKNNVQEEILKVKKIEIHNKAELEDFRDMVNNGVSFQGDTVELMSDIDLEGSESNPNWNSIGGQNTGKAFSGIFEGNNHKISHIYIFGNGSIGFFGKVTNAIIQNLGIESGSIISRRLIWWDSWKHRQWKYNKLL